MRIYAIEDRYLKNLRINQPEAYPFSEIFGAKNWRTAFPLYNSKIKEIKNKLESGDTKSKRKYKVDVPNQTAYVEGDKRVFRLGKVIGQDLGKEWLDEWSRQMASINADTDKGNYMIIVSRHPYDVVRMSDFNRMESCHSEPGKNLTESDFFHCAFEEATDGGPVAYVVNREDYESVKDDLQAEDLFNDYERGISRGIEPISRMRLNRYVNREDENITMPVLSVYGERVAGFAETLTEWAREKQPKYFGEDADRLYMNEWGRRGGSYVDVVDNRIWNNFFGVSTYTGQAKYEGEGGEAVADLWEQELVDHNLRARGLRHVLLSAEVEESDGVPYISVFPSIFFSFPGVIKENIPMKSWEYDGRNIDTHGNEVFKSIDNAINKQVDWGTVDQTEWQFDYKDGNTLTCNAVIGSYDNISNPDDFSNLIDEAERFEEKDYNDLYTDIYQILFQNEMVKQIPMDDFLGNSKFNHLNLEEGESPGEHTVTSSVFSVLIPPGLNDNDLKQIGKDAYDYVKSFVQKIYNKNVKDLLFKMDVPEFAIDSLPEAKVSFKNVPRSVWIGEQGNPFNWREHERNSIGSELRITFEVSLPMIAGKDAHLFKILLQYMDKYYESMMFEIRKELDRMIKEKLAMKTPPQAAVMASSWYDRVRDDLCLS